MSVTTKAGAADLSREELLKVLDAVREMTRATGECDHERTVEVLLRIVAEATGSDRSNIYSVDEPAGCLVLRGYYPLDPDRMERFRVLPIDGSRTGAAIRAARPETWTIDDVKVHGAAAKTLGLRHIAVVPLLVRGKILAAMNLARSADRPYGERELRFAESLGDLLVVYVENALLYADARRALDETRMLLDVVRTVGASIELDQRLDASCEVLTRLVDASTVHLLLLEGDVLHGCASSNRERRDEIRAVRVPMTAVSTAVRAVQLEQTVTVEDASVSTEVRRELVDRWGQKSLLAVPLLVQGRPIGVLLIDDTRAVRRWTESEVQRAEFIAQNVAGAIANARLYDEVRRRSQELERAQQELVKRERLAALGQIAATLAHEVRNPLAVFFNSIGTLRKTLPSVGDEAMLLTIMSEEAVRLEHLVRELLDFARPPVPSFELEALGTVIAGAADAAAREIAPASADIAVEMAPELPLVRLDGSMMRRAILNLVINGVHAAGPAGSVRIRGSIETRQDQVFARIEVSDSGRGIPLEDRARIFEPFFTTKATGTGLGLAVVKSIVESHGGEIDVASGERGGTTVSITIPAGKTETTPPTAGSARSRCDVFSSQ